MTETIQKFTVKSVTALIQQIAESSIANKVVATPTMQHAFAGVIALIEDRSPKSAQLTAALNKVREAVGLPLPPTDKQKETTNANPL